MFIAEKLRKTSIAEYLLYMWQTEDLIRAYGCSLSRIKKEYISRFDYDDEQMEYEMAFCVGVNDGCELSGPPKASAGAVSSSFVTASMYVSGSTTSESRMSR